MRKILLLRHGMTKGNLERRYVGKTDESLTEECREKLRRLVALETEMDGRRKCEAAGWSEVSGRPADRGILEASIVDLYRRLGKVDAVYTSPLMRCQETADLLFPPERYPNAKRIAVPALAECDFGGFEYKNYEELNGNPDYQLFLDTNGESGFPGGETVTAFKNRCVQSFSDILFSQTTRKQGEPDDGTLVFVVHGGTIMTIMEEFVVPKKDYYSWQVRNVCGFFSAFQLQNGRPVLGEVAKVEIL